MMPAVELVQKAHCVLLNVPLCICVCVYLDGWCGDSFPCSFPCACRLFDYSKGVDSRRNGRSFEEK